jgi:cytochrome c peroxidase
LAGLKPLLLAAALLLCTASKAYEWQLPLGFPEPQVPHDNPMSTAKVELGRLLFFDTRLSYNQTYSCATCHQPKLAFTDGLSKAIGSTGQIHTRNTMSLTNVAYNLSFSWADNLHQNLEAQALVPLLNVEPIEMGVLNHEKEILKRYSDDANFQSLVTQAFELDAASLGKPFSLDHIQKALASFQRTLISGSSPYDDWLFNDNKDALTASAKKGMSLFFSKALACGECHQGLNFSGDFSFNRNKRPEQNGRLAETAQIEAKPIFTNNGLYKSYQDDGLAKLSRLESDLGLFKIPTLRNINLTAPYMHDGKLKDLSEVIAHYAQGGSGHANQDKRVKGFLISPTEKAQLIAFLHSLSDPQFSQPH